MPILNLYDPLVSDEEVYDTYIEIENLPVQSVDENTFAYDAAARFRLEQIIENFAALDAAGETAHRTWELNDGSSVVVDETAALNYFNEIKQKAAIRAVAAKDQYLQFLADGNTTFGDLDNWKAQYV